METLTTQRRLTTGQVAARLGIGIDAVRELVRRGELPATRYGTGWLRFDRSDVDALAERARQGGQHGG